MVSPRCSLCGRGTAGKSAGFYLVAAGCEYLRGSRSGCFSIAYLEISGVQARFAIRTHRYQFQRIAAAGAPLPVRSTVGSSSPDHEWKVLLQLHLEQPDA